MASSEDPNDTGNAPDQGEARFELVSGEDPKEIRALIHVLREMLREKKCEALGEWIKDHASPAPLDREEIQDLQKKLETLESLLHRAENEGKALEVQVPARVRLRSEHSTGS
ncbi:MAG: hypothetical protein ABEH38_08575 [Flavobacteriales bacterium]